MGGFPTSPNPIYPIKESLGFLVETQETNDKTQQRIMGNWYPYRKIDLKYRYFTATQKATWESFFNAEEGMTKTFSFTHPITGVVYDKCRLLHDDIQFKFYVNDLWKFGSIKMLIQNTSETIPADSTFPDLFWKGYTERKSFKKVKYKFDSVNDLYYNIKENYDVITVSFANLNYSEYNKIVDHYKWMGGALKKWTLTNKADSKTYNVRYEDTGLNYVYKTYKTVDLKIKIKLLGLVD